MVGILFRWMIDSWPNSFNQQLERKVEITFFLQSLKWYESDETALLTYDRSLSPDRLSLCDEIKYGEETKHKMDRILPALML